MIFMTNFPLVYRYMNLLVLFLQEEASCISLLLDLIADSCNHSSVTPWSCATWFFFFCEPSSLISLSVKRDRELVIVI